MKTIWILYFEKKGSENSRLIFQAANSRVGLFTDLSKGPCNSIDKS